MSPASASDRADLAAVNTMAPITRLVALAEELAGFGLSASLRAVPGRVPCLRVVNPRAARLTEQIYAGRARDGRWWYWWPWRERIAPVGEAAIAARVIARVLALDDGIRPAG